MSPRDLVAAFSRFSRAARRQDGQASQARQRRTARPATRAPHLAAERLESRCMLSTTARLENNISMFDRIPVIHPLRPANVPTSFVGQFAWSGFNSFCVEIGQSISPGLHTFPTRAPLASSGLANAGLVADFWRSYGPKTTGFTSVTDAAAFQLGIWELISDGPSRNLKSGSFQVGASASPAVARAESWLNGTGTPAPSAGGPAVSLYVLQHPTRQDQVVWEPLPNITVQVAPPSVAEDGPHKLTYTFTATGPLTRDVTVNYSVGGSATAGSDFTGLPAGASTGAITIPANATTASVAVVPMPDAESEYDETVVLTLLSGTGYALGTRTVATGTILDDDGNEVTISATDNEADEVKLRPDTPSTGAFRLSRSGSVAGDLFVKLNIGGSATYSAFATDDYALTNVRSALTGYFATIPRGSRSVDISVVPFQGGADEDTETVMLTVDDYAGYSVGKAKSATVTILDAPHIALASVACRIDLDARPAVRGWPVDAAERILPDAPRGTLRPGEPYVFTLNGLGQERDTGISWELFYHVSTGDGDADIRVKAGTGTSFPHTFTIDDEVRPFLVGWHVRFFVDANRDGISNISESRATGRFENVIQDRKGIVAWRLEKEKEVHAGTMYDEVFKVSAYFDELVRVAQKVSYSRNSVASADATYGYLLNQIAATDAENSDIATLIHEATHALDDDRNWTPGLVPTYFQLDRVEGVGWTASFLLTPNGSSPTMKLREFEAVFKAPIVDQAVVRQRWMDCITGMRNVMNRQVQARVARDVNNDDVRAVREDVGLWFNMTALMARYQRKLDERGVQVLLESSVRQGVGIFSIPEAFLE
jgi:hypothetical protein